MGKNKKDAVLQVVELKNSVFATAGSYPGGADEGAYVYVRKRSNPNTCRQNHLGI